MFSRRQIEIYGASAAARGVRREVRPCGTDYIAELDPRTLISCGSVVEAKIRLKAGRHPRIEVEYFAGGGVRIVWPPHQPDGGLRLTAVVDDPDQHVLRIKRRGFLSTQSVLNLLIDINPDRAVSVENNDKRTGGPRTVGSRGINCVRTRGREFVSLRRTSSREHSYKYKGTPKRRLASHKPPSLLGSGLRSK